jgi:hypothetical protein
MTPTAIAAVVPRRPAFLHGWVVTVSAHVRPWVRLNVELCDGTGRIVLRFMGRTEIPGIVPGCRMSVEGTSSVEGDALVMLNPRYTFLGGHVPDRDKRSQWRHYPAHCLEES